MEELAFADAKGQNLIKWPPRSYCCSFCRREFKSAQALGGHMNVHRRDKARLKHSPIYLQNPVHDEYNLGFDHNPVQFQVSASSSSSWSGDHCEGEQVLKKQKSRAVLQHFVMNSFCVDLKLQIADNDHDSDDHYVCHNKKRPRTDDDDQLELQALPLLLKPDFDTYNFQDVVEIKQISAAGSTTEGLDLELRL